MSYLNGNYLPFLILVGLVLILGLHYIFKKNDSFVAAFWFRKAGFGLRVSRFLYFTFFLILLYSLLDLRGPAQKVDSNVPDQKTIILFDMSSSMLVEDIRPSRIRRAIFLARHFVKKAVGHQISIVLFSHSTKQFLPFTDDLDILDGKLDSLEAIDISQAPSNISVAINETVSIFSKDLGVSREQVGGNILLFTDGEESYDELALKVPENIHLAVVGLGTTKGGPIPLRRKDGSFLKYRKFQNENIVSKLNEDYFKEVCSKISKCRYWIGTSFSVPTEEVIGFFNSHFKSQLEKKDSIVRPVYGHWVVLIGIVVYFFSFLFSRGRSYVLLLCFAFLPYFNRSMAEEKKVNKNLEELTEQLKTGNLERSKKLKIGEELLREKEYEKARKIFEESITDIEKEDELVKANYINSLLGSKDYKKASETYDQLKKSNSFSQSTMDELRKNFSGALVQVPPPPEKSKKDDKKDKDKNDKNQSDQQSKDSKEQDQNSQSDKKQGNSQDQNESQQNKPEDNKDKKESDTKDQKDKEKNKEDKSQDSEKKKEQDENKENGEKKESESKSWEEKVKEIEQKRKMKNMSGRIRQILNDDRELQKKKARTDLQDRSRPEEKRDW